LPASTTKKALIRRFERETLAGYVNPASFLQPEGVELLSDQGHASIVPYPEIKLVAFVKEFEGAAEPQRQVFQTRPKMAGLWVNLRFRDGGVLEGIIPNNLMLLEGGGFTVIPPDSFGNQQRVWAPRGALVALEVLGVVGSPLRRRKAKPAAKEQIGLFD
jgi:hypothetical protein